MGMYSLEGRLNSPLNRINAWNKKHLKNVGPIRHNELPHAHSADVASGRLLSRAACSSMSTTTTTTTTTTRDRGDRYGPIWNGPSKHCTVCYASCMWPICMGASVRYGNNYSLCHDVGSLAYTVADRAPPLIVATTRLMLHCVPLRLRSQSKKLVVCCMCLTFLVAVGVLT